MKLSTLSEWQAWISRLNAKEIDLDLSRVRCVLKRLSPHPLLSCPILVVGGTNGKGSTVKTLETIYIQAGYRVGVFNSPCLFRFNEYIRVNGVDLEDADYVRLFLEVEQSRGEVPLTPFEYVAIASFLHFARIQVDVCILEVGLGGRLDAVNALDADVAIVTSIGLDHQAYLGNTRDAIGLEKVEIARKGRPFICGDAEPPESFLRRADQLGAVTFLIHRNFSLSNGQFENKRSRLSNLTLPPLFPSNVACALQAIDCLKERLSVSDEVIRAALANVRLTGRLEVLRRHPDVIVDVSHNVDAVRVLSKWLEDQPCLGKTRTVFSMLADKDIGKCIQAIDEKIDHWYVAPLTVDRAAPLTRLQSEMSQSGVTENVTYWDSVKEAYQHAIQEAKEEDRVVVFGSFHTVAAVLMEK